MLPVLVVAAGRAAVVVVADAAAAGWRWSVVLPLLVVLFLAAAATGWRCWVVVALGRCRSWWLVVDVAGAGRLGALLVVDAGRRWFVLVAGSVAMSPADVVAAGGPGRCCRVSWSSVVLPALVVLAGGWWLAGVLLGVPGGCWWLGVGGRCRRRWSWFGGRGMLPRMPGVVAGCLAVVCAAGGR